MPYDNENKSSDQQTAQQVEQGPTYVLTQDEIVFIENVLVELRSLIPNDMGENMAIMEKIVLAEQIIGARLDPDSAAIGDSA